uniref:Uncharacterized protein n=1 Tax=Cucumis melo TaxID=3656 RepID=A0A9I9E100_CUCME
LCVGIIPKCISRSYADVEIDIDKDVEIKIDKDVEIDIDKDVVRMCRCRLFR